MRLNRRFMPTVDSLDLRAVPSTVIADVGVVNDVIYEEPLPPHTVIGPDGLQISTELLCAPLPPPGFDYGPDGLLISTVLMSSTAH